MRYLPWCTSLSVWKWGWKKKKFLNCSTLLPIRFQSNFEDLGFCMKMRSYFKKQKKRVKIGKKFQNSFKDIMKLTVEIDMQNSPTSICRDCGLKTRQRFCKSIMKYMGLTTEQSRRKFPDEPPNKLKIEFDISIERKKDTLFQMMMTNAWFL